MKIKILTLLFTACCSIQVMGQHVSYQSFPHYQERVKEFERMRPIDSTDVVMLGNSLTEYGGDWNRLLRSRHIRNRGIAGDDAMGMIHRLVQILPGRPKAIFLMVGINDMSHQLSAEEVFKLCKQVIDKIRLESPTTHLYVQSLLPINESFGRWKTLEGRTNDVATVNMLLRKYCEHHHIAYINIFKKMIRHGTYEMRKELTVDGLHLTPLGYKQWAFILRQYLEYDLL